MENRTWKTGGVIDARCGKCKAITNHTILALVDNRPARVRCDTCKGEHGYRPPEADAPPVSVGKVVEQETKGSQTAERKLWQTLEPAMDRTQAKSYTQAGGYKARDLVDHPIFGLGIVLQVSGNQVDILFRDGKKTLRGK